MSTYHLEHIVSRATELSDAHLMNIVHALHVLEAEELPERQRGQVKLLIGRVAFEASARTNETKPENDQVS